MSSTNTVRHAEAQHINIILYMNSKNIFLSVIDDGIGCDINTIESGFGLRGMQERIKIMGGELNISSRVQQGMKVTAIIPHI
jgi:two-component system sensor histidine kinase UhpB